MNNFYSQTKGRAFMARANPRESEYKFDKFSNMIIYTGESKKNTVSMRSIVENISAANLGHRAQTRRLFRLFLVAQKGAG
jgi:hypothetical protein